MRGKTIVILFIFFSILFRTIPSFGHVSNCDVLLAGLLDVKKEGGEFVYNGLTERGIQVLTAQHDDILKSEQIIASKLFEMESFTSTTRIVQVGRWNVMVLGDPGGAKTRLFMVMIPNLWIKQVHAMMNEVPLIGGVSEDDNKAGRDGLNISGTILDGVMFAMIDEGEKLNPAVQSVLLSLLNPDERFVTVAGKKIEAKDLRSIIYTGNATLPELLEYFQQQGQGTTGPAYLNRFMAKFRVPNWLSEEAQAKIDAMKAKRDFLKTLASMHPEVLQDLVFQDPPDLDFDSIESFANSAFELTPEAYVVMRSFIRQLKDETNRAIRESEVKNKEDNTTEPYILTPAVEFSERVRGDIARWVRVSAALDFLRSPMATKENIARFTAKKIKLGPLSLWRTWNMLTTVGPNRTIFDPFTRKVYFGARLRNGKVIPDNVEERIANAKDSREQLELTHIKRAQERFEAAISTKWIAMKNSLEEAARLLGTDVDDLDFEDVDFEVALARLGGTDVMKLSQDGGGGDPNALKAPENQKSPR